MRVGGCFQHFNPLPRKEGDYALMPSCSKCSYFNPLPRKEGDLLRSDSPDLSGYFNPLPRKEGDEFFVSNGI